jgi:hypothetical protein
MSLVLMVMLLVSLIPATTHAQQPLDMEVTPQAGPPDTTITIEGEGAPPNHLIQVYYAAYSDVDMCDAARGADGVFEVMSDANGRFSTTRQVPQPVGKDTIGVSYRSEIAPNGEFSNYECFIYSERDFPPTDHQLSGRFLSYWQTHGGLDVFGYPLTDERTEEGRTVQYLERSRFEYAPQNAPPYDVLLGRIGVDVMEQQGLNWQEMPTSAGPVTGCLYFEQTDHNVCNQLGTQGIGFLNYWQSHGLEFDGEPGSSHQESLALFGLPLTEPYDYEIDGETVQVQWFERARFEWHPDNPPGSRVLLGRLGAWLVNPQQRQPQQPPEVGIVRLYFIALGDEGQSGMPVGCGDSIVPVTIDIEPTVAPLTAAFEHLLDIDEEYYGQSGLYNPLHTSDLTLDSAAVENGRATIYLSGDLQIPGMCEHPRLEAQLRQTADQFSTVGESIIYINDERLENIVSLRGQ